MNATNRTNIDRQAGSGKLPAGTSSETPKLEICHPSVCVGGAKATNCVCPTTKK